MSANSFLPSTPALLHKRGDGRGIEGEGSLQTASNLYFEYVWSRKLVTQASGAFQLIATSLVEYDSMLSM